MIELTFFGLIAGVLIGWWVIDGGPRQKAKQYHEKFISLGTLRGKTRTEIEKVTGQPSSWLSAGPNKIMCTYSVPRYLIILIYENDICEGVNSEIRTY